ncbi:MAG: cyclopropane-fatty-acyl-phospholipid synthase [Thermoleophilaceae bacterium]|nr:cyclopropane-fatty-acyl-phospholipid synthase [Thermoleophilaceae bacterium]
MPSAAPLRDEIARTFPDRPFAIEFWDGSALPPTNGHGPTFRVESRKAIGHALRAPGQLGIGRAYVAGDIAIDDLDAAMHVVGSWHPPAVDRKTQAKLALAALKAAGPMLPPSPPSSELRPKGRLHTITRDRRSVRHHYDLPPEFFKLFLGESLAYSCAIFSRGASTLEEAQRTKLELVCTKLNLQSGQRVLDVGCGWGSFAVHAAAEYGVHVTGITLSEPQALLARERADAADVGSLVDIRVADYRELRGERFDAIASIGMVEHVGEAQIDLYAQQLAGLIAPGGRLLNHGIARLRHHDPPAGPFSERYVFPDADPLQLSRVTLALERAGFEVEHVEGFREDYAETLRHWARRLDDNLDEATRLAGAERARVWRLYLRAARNGFETGFTSIYQVRCHAAS